MNLSNKQTSCPVKRLRSYKNNSELLLAWIKFIVLKSLCLGKLESTIHIRRSMQKTFLSWVAKLHKWGSCTYMTQTWVLKESLLSEFWKDIFFNTEYESKIADINQVILGFQNSIEEYKYRSKMGAYGAFHKFNTKILSLTNTIPESRDELAFIINTTLVVIMSFRMHFKEQMKNIDTAEERVVLLKIVGSVIGTLLTLQKRKFNNAVLAFMENISTEASWKQIFPIKFNWSHYSDPEWTFTEQFSRSMDTLMNTWSLIEHWYTDMRTSCPAVTDWLIPYLITQVFDIVYVTPKE